MHNEIEHKGEELVETVKDYLNTRYDLTRLKLIHSASEILAALIGFFLLLVAGMFFLLFISWAVANYLCVITETKNAGYFIVAGFYLIVTILLVIIREKGIHIPLENRFIKQFLKK
ncbi:MAG TPA: hypothetical protein VE978_18475 [Chitinophagales bacterium]|nr:hypothetical protein [Chitinophagales bacterium]